MSTTKVAIALVCLLHVVLTSATVWPQPAELTTGTAVVNVDPASFTIKTTSQSSLLARAIARYTDLFFPFSTTSSMVEEVSSFTLSVFSNSDSEDLQLGTDDSYNITVDESVGTIYANTVFGAIYGLETFSQLINFDSYSLSYSISAVPLTINDYARFPWRGLLLDSSRHFLDIDTIKTMIDALSYNKMNVLHWHLVDAQSFPVETIAYPLLVKGAYSPAAVYSNDDLTSLIDYAKDRGVRVVPEFDMPGHAYSWGIGYPELTVYCPSYEANINNIPLDPSQPFTYEVINGLLSEMAGVFQDNFLHVGGDEVVFSCWKENTNVSTWMYENDYDSYDAEQYFCTQVQEILLTIGKTGVVWQDLYANGISMPSDTVVQVWEDLATLGSVANSGMRGLLSFGWYLDKQIPDPPSTHYEFEDTWQDFYMIDPVEDSGVEWELSSNILGGEAAMWGEQVDFTNIQSRVWPRTCAVGERLWSSEELVSVTAATPRLVEFRCHMAQRGIRAGPIAPDYCVIP